MPGFASSTSARHRAGARAARATGRDPAPGLRARRPRAGVGRGGAGRRSGCPVRSRSRVRGDRRCVRRVAARRGHRRAAWRRGRHWQDSTRRGDRAACSPARGARAHGSLLGRRRRARLLAVGADHPLVRARRRCGGNLGVGVAPLARLVPGSPAPSASLRHNPLTQNARGSSCSTPRRPSCAASPTTSLSSSSSTTSTPAMRRRSCFCSSSPGSSTGAVRSSSPSTAPRRPPGAGPSRTS